MRNILRAFGALLGVLVIGVGAWADSGPLAPQNPISGRVVEISQVEELFLHLDTDGDGQGDIWAKIENDSTLVDVDGQPLSPSDIALGTLVLLTSYKFEGKFYEIIQAVVGEGELSGNGALSGHIVDTFPFGENVYVNLDTDSDGLGDLAVKVKRTGLMTDASGRATSSDTLQPGVRLQIISFALDADGFFVTWHVIIGAAENAGPSPMPLVAGTLVERHTLGGVVFARLDNDGDGLGELPVRLSAQTQLSATSGTALTLEDAQLGTQVEVLRYTFVEGYYETFQGVISP